MTVPELNVLKATRITAKDMPISMNAASERLHDLAIEWEEHNERFEDINPFFVALREIRDKSLKWKEQEPRVLSVDEWCNDRITPDDGTPLCYEVREASGRCYIKWMLEKVFKRVPEYYGVHFRCWTSKPTEDQRKNTTWVKPTDDQQKDNPWIEGD